MAHDTPNIKLTLKTTGSLAPEYFDRLYAKRADPWNFATSAYEAEKYMATLAVLPDRRYPNALDLGCSIGVLTHQLAPRCDRLLAVDVSDAALEQARTRCADIPQVTFKRCDVSTQFPKGRFDLIVVSEIGYYFSMLDLKKLRAHIAAALAPRAHLLLVHYTGETNYPLNANTVHDSFITWQEKKWSHLISTRGDSYRLDLLERTELSQSHTTSRRNR